MPSSLIGSVMPRIRPQLRSENRQSRTVLAALGGLAGALIGGTIPKDEPQSAEASILIPGGRKLLESRVASEGIPKRIHAEPRR